MGALLRNVTINNKNMGALLKNVTIKQNNERGT